MGEFLFHSDIVLHPLFHFTARLDSRHEDVDAGVKLFPSFFHSIARLHRALISVLHRRSQGDNCLDCT